ncbi:MAG: hypothetical protein AABZ08_00445 [Planctomycetota bacterium]
MWKLKVYFGLGAIALVSVAACNSLPSGLLGGLGNTSGDNSAVARFLPEGVSLDVSELPDSDSGANEKGKDDASSMGITTPYQRTLHSAARIVHNFHRLADRALALGAMIRNDMTDPTQTQVAGTFNVNGTVVSYKADFAAFDIDGDSVADGSGNAVDTPVAIRIWTDRGTGYERFLCALVTTKPSTDNFGAGVLYTKPGAARPDAPADFQAHVKWDRTDSSHKWNEAFISGALRDVLKLNNSHDRVDVRVDGSTNALEKTVRSATDFADNPYGLSSIQSSVHFMPGSGYALMSSEAVTTGGTFNFTDVCVDLVDQALATGGECSAFDTQDMSFIDAPVGGESDFPADFAETPTFDATGETTGG